MENHYLILGVLPNATDEEIRKKYLEKIKFYHSDKWHDNPQMYKTAEEETIKLNLAYQVLSNKEERAKFDKEIKKSNSNTNYQEEPNEPPYQKTESEPKANHYANNTKYEQSSYYEPSEESKKQSSDSAFNNYGQNSNYSNYSSIHEKEDNTPQSFPYNKVIAVVIIIIIIVSYFYISTHTQFGQLYNIRPNSIPKEIILPTKFIGSFLYAH